MSEEFDPGKNVNLDENRELMSEAEGNAVLERVGLLGRVFFDEAQRFYWMQDARGEWRGRSEMMFSQYLKRYGVNAVRDDKNKQSELDLLILHVSLNWAVYFSGPVAGFSKGIIENNGQRILVTRSPRLLVPTKGEFPVLRRLIDQQFGAQGQE